MSEIDDILKDPQEVSGLQGATPAQKQTVGYLQGLTGFGWNGLDWNEVLVPNNSQGLWVDSGGTIHDTRRSTGGNFLDNTLGSALSFLFADGRSVVTLTAIAAIYAVAAYAGAAAVTGVGSTAVGTGAGDAPVAAATAGSAGGPSPAMLNTTAANSIYGTAPTTGFTSTGYPAYGTTLMSEPLAPALTYGGGYGGASGVTAFGPASVMGTGAPGSLFGSPVGTGLVYGGSAGAMAPPLFGEMPSDFLGPSPGAGLPSSSLTAPPGVTDPSWWDKLIKNLGKLFASPTGTGGTGGTGTGGSTIPMGDTKTTTVSYPKQSQVSWAKHVPELYWESKGQSFQPLPLTGGAAPIVSRILSGDGDSSRVAKAEDNPEEWVKQLLKEMGGVR